MDYWILLTQGKSTFEMLIPAATIILAGFFTLTGHILVGLFSNKYFKASIDSKLNANFALFHKELMDFKKDVIKRFKKNEKINQRTKDFTDACYELEKIFENSLRRCKDKKIKKVITEGHRMTLEFVREILDVGLENVKEYTFRQKITIRSAGGKRFAERILGKEFVKDWDEIHGQYAKQYAVNVIKMIDPENPHNKFNNTVSKFIRISATFMEDAAAGMLLAWEIFKEGQKNDTNIGS